MLIHECQYTHNQLLFIYINKYINKIPNFIIFSCDNYILSTVHNYWTSHVVKTKCYLRKFCYPWLLEPTSAMYFFLPWGLHLLVSLLHCQICHLTTRRARISHCTHTHGSDVEQVNYTQDSSFLSKIRRRAAQGGIWTHDTLLVHECIYKHIRHYGKGGGNAYVYLSV